MKWISVDQKPKTDMVALVCNEKGWMASQKAIYHSRYDVWVLDDPNDGRSLLLDVTHYIEIPLHPRKEDGK